MRLGQGLSLAARPIIPFLPTSISGLQLWLDGLDNSSITQASGLVSQWSDKSGNARHVTQATGANKPTLTDASIGARQGLVFDGANSKMSSASQTLTLTTITLLVVLKFASAADVLSSPLSYGGYALNAFSWGRLTAALAGGQDAMGVRFNAASISYSTTAYSATVPHLLELTITGTTPLFYMDGTVQTSSGALLSSFSVVNQVFSLGWDGTTALFNGSIGEVILYDTVLSATNRGNVETYLKAKWGL